MLPIYICIYSCILLFWNLLDSIEQVPGVCPACRNKFLSSPTSVAWIMSYHLSYHFLSNADTLTTKYNRTCISVLSATGCFANWQHQTVTVLSHNGSIKDSSPLMHIHRWLTGLEQSPSHLATVPLFNICHDRDI
jgi:hypothetical protein